MPTRREPSPASAPDHDDLAAEARRVLAANDRGGWTRPSPRLYPHQWSWDSAFVAIGLAVDDPDRAVTELRSLLGAQWRNGKIPHIVFDPRLAEDSYFPGPEVWGISASPDAPAGAATSGLCQPPVHAIALHRAWLRHPEAVGSAVAELWPALLAWHRYLHTARDPEGSDLVTILHPWESGLDNSPRWDAALARVEVGDLAPYRRHDITHVADATQRPTDADYDRYLWLVERLQAVGYDDARATAEHPFRVKDVLFSAVLAAADDALADLAPVAGQGAGIAGHLRAHGVRTRAALAATAGADGLARDLDLVSGAYATVRTLAGLAPLIAAEPSPPGAAPTPAVAALVQALDAADLCGDPRLRWAVPPSTATSEPTFDPRGYWRGPTWPVITWLVWWALERSGAVDRADRMRAAALEQLTEAGLAEYVEPFTGEALGSASQSWTAAVALDWLAGPPAAP